MLTKMWLIGICLLVSLTVLCCSQDWVREEPEPRLHGSVDGTFRYGNVDGFLQIPSGGVPGTTSNRRPKFHEIGINNAPTGDPSVSLGWGNNEFYAGARFVRLSGNDTLDNTLISHGTTFPAGSSVSTNTQLDWYRGGYEYRPSYRNSEGASVSFYPSLGFGLLNFDYKLTAPGALSATRSFVKAAPQLGLKSEWSPGGRFFLSGEVLSSLAFSTLPLLFSTDVTQEYQVWGRASQGGRVFFGVGHDMIHFEDNERVPNHIKTDIGPEVVVGFSVSF
jgi:hypothetical protein